MRTSRRFFLSGASALAATMVAGGASAQDVIADILKSSGRSNWDDQFDARASQGGKVASTLPIVSLQTVAYTEQAIAQYQNIVAQGGWGPVPDTKKLQLGVVDPDVVPLRRRLMISGDLAQGAGISEAFDSYVDSAVKRFQARHGLPADGTLGQYTYAAMNVSAQVRLGQLQTNLQRLNERAGTLGNRYVLVDIPGAQIEAVENDRVVLRHTAVVGKIDRQTPIVDSKINEIIVNPYWNAPVSIVRKDIIPLMRKDPNYLKDSKIRLFAPDGSEVDPLTVDWSTDDAEKYRFRQDPGSGNAMASVKINFPSPDGVYMHDTPQKGLFNNEFRFDSSGCVRIQGIRELIVWLLRDTPSWTRDQIDYQFRSGERLDVQLAQPIQLYWTYVTAWAATEGVVQFRNDIYNLDGLDVYAAQQTEIPL
jgi:murein L,D-transpeptidase YcbB/YkuD